MSKELPFFKFYPSEWFEGDITLQNEKTQGLFILICAWYWKKDCVVDLKFIQKRLIIGKASLKQCLTNLIDAEIIKIDDNQRVVIKFLDKQYDELSNKRMKLVEAGRKGGKASLKHRRSNKEVEVEKEVEKEIYKEEGFLEFWGKYHSITGLPKTDKEPAQKHWKRLSVTEQKKAIDNVEDYYNSIDKRYCKKARTYLAEKNFNDEFKSASKYSAGVHQTYDDMRK